ncbi:MAG: hypothetical protein KDJ31_18875 [Candidatus Competibacteraceae bacterium]|nr:hypothetical protein [Candidatus Competibacteraceae bacterium]
MMHSMHILSSCASACLICHTPLPFHQARKSQLCGRAECEWRYSLLQQQDKVCKICGRPLSIREQLFGVCANAACQHAMVADRARQEREQREKWYQAVREQAARLRRRVASNFGIPDEESFRLTVVPASLSQIIRLPAQRRREFRNYLKELIDKAFIRPIPPAVDPGQTAPLSDEDARLQAASGQACACCRGSCCQGGGFTHAYLEIATIQRYRTAHPNQRPRGVLAAYMNYVGDETAEGSCVYHQTDGCSLPKEMRADICNDFYCGGLQDFRQSVMADSPVRGFFVAATEDTIHRAALVHENQALMVPAPTTDPD